jgi:hypothetical protein
LLVNLSAAGGISFAGVVTSFWLMAALVVNKSAVYRTRCVTPGWLPVVLAIAALLLLIACQQTMYGPVLAAQGQLGQGMQYSARGQATDAETAFHAAAVTDRYDPTPWFYLAGLHQHQWLAAESERTAREFERCVGTAVSLNRRAFSLRRQIGNWRLALFRRWNRTEHMKAAIEAYSDWVRLYPTSNLGHAQLAWAHHVAGDAGAAAREAKEALRLDSLTPHRERKLGMQQVFDSDASAIPTSDAEQLMQFLRSAARSGDSDNDGGRID